MHTDFYFPSCGGGMIHGCRWEPEGAPKAVLQIVHGIAEHVQRYAHFAEFMASQGFLVVAEDHMGHGGSIGDDGVQGYFQGGWFKAVADVHRLLSYTRMECPNVPYILLGHSMGSFLVRTLLCKYPKCGVSAAIISGTAWMHRGILNSGIAAATLAGKRQGFDQPSKMLNSMMFSGYNKKIEHWRTAFDWLTRDAKIVDAYVADPLCGFTVTAGLARDMLTGLKYIQEPENLDNMKKELPVLFIAGSDDPVGNYGQGVKQTVQAFTQAGMENVSMRLYPLCRHEVLNELNREEVYHNLLEWLARQDGRIV
jgi:alpha-beta hydrolase superfamily lysophospholipase